MWKKGARLLVLVLAALLLPVSAWAATVEQTQAVMPVVDVYLCDDETGSLAGLQKEQITASLDGKLLEVVDYDRASRLSAGTCYIVLMDISLSVRSYDLNAAKQAFLDAYGRLRQGDQLALITFGDEVTTVLRGGESYAEVEAALNGIRPKDQTTALYGAIRRALELSANKASDGLRNVAIVVTDGVDETEAGVTLAELQAQTQYNSLSLYALCVKNGSQAKRDQLGAYARALGGELYLFDTRTAGEQLGAILDRLDDSMLLRLRAENNLADGGTHDLNLRLGDRATVSTRVTTAFWTPDTQPPRLVEAVNSRADGAVLLRFSEVVDQVELLSNYELRGADGTGVRIASAGYAEGGETAVELLPAAAPYEGEYTLRVQGLTDRSMERNALPPTEVSLTLRTGVFPVVETEPPPEVPPEPVDLWWLYLLVALAVLVAIVLLISHLVRQETKRNGEKERRLAGRTNAIPAGGRGPAASKRFWQIRVAGPGIDKELTLSSISPVVFGRMDECDVPVDDPAVSRRHCVMTCQNGEVWLTDLGSSNGTELDGNPVGKGGLRLSLSTDRINSVKLQIGDTELRVKLLSSADS